MGSCYGNVNLCCTEYRLVGSVINKNNINYCINTGVTRHEQPFINEENIEFTRASAVYTSLLLMLVTGRHAKHVPIMRNWKSARNEHKNKSFYAYENLMRL